MSSPVKFNPNIRFMQTWKGYNLKAAGAVAAYIISLLHPASNLDVAFRIGSWLRIYPENSITGFNRLNEVGV